MNSIKKTLLLSLLGSGGLGASIATAHSELITPGVPDPWDTITVTGDYLSEDETNAPAQIISGDFLNQLNITDIHQALSMAAGVNLNRSGGVGQLTAIRMRGSESNHVVILIDGIEFLPNDTGSYDLSGISVANIERIEILRGPQSGIFGSNAAAGVINIVTKYGISNVVNTKLALDPFGQEIAASFISYTETSQIIQTYLVKIPISSKARPASFTTKFRMKSKQFLDQFQPCEMLTATSKIMVSNKG